MIFTEPFVRHRAAMIFMVELIPRTADARSWGVCKDTACDAPRESVQHLALGGIENGVHRIVVRLVVL